MYNNIAKLISSITVTCFFITNVFGSILQNPFSGSHTAYDYKGISLSKQYLPRVYGDISEVSYIPGAPVFIVLNDYHGNSNAQANINNIIEYFGKISKIDNIIVEGAPCGRNNLKLFETIPADIRYEILTEMLKKGNISGAEYFAVKNEFQNLFGLEQWDIYLKNLKNSEVLNGRYEKEIVLLKQYFTEILNNEYGRKKAFVKLFSNSGDIKSDVLNIGRYCVKNNIDISGYKDLYGFINYHSDSSKSEVNKELKSMLSEAAKKMPYGVYSDMIKAVKNGAHGGFRNFYEISKNYCPELLVKYNELAFYLQNEDSAASVRTNLIFEQLDILKEQILENHSDSTEKDLAAIDRLVYLLSEYSKLSLTYGMYLYISANKTEFYRLCFKYLNAESLKTINEILNDQELISYYKINILRNEIFYKNICGLMGLKREPEIKHSNDPNSVFGELQNGKPVNIIIIGGFHTEFVEMLKKTNVSVITVFPKSNAPETNKDALAPPLKIVSKDPASVAVIIQIWLERMKSVVNEKKQREVINKWLKDNEIGYDFSFDEKGNPVFDNLSLEDVLKYETYNIHEEPAEHINFRTRLKNKIRNFFNLGLSLFKKILTRTSVPDSASTVTEYFTNTVLEQNVLKHEYDMTLDSLNGSMPDAIVFTVESLEDKEYCERLLSDLRKYPSFAGVSTEYAVIGDKGSGAAFTEAVKHISDMDEYRTGKSRCDLKVLVMNIGSENRDSVGSDKIPLAFNGRNITPFELAVLNGIRSLRNFTKGGIAVIDPKAVYVGNMKKAGDITFITSFVNMKELEHSKMSLAVADHPDRLEQIYYGFNPGSISDIVEKKGLERRGVYNFDNKSVRQFEVITGNILINFDDERKYSDFFDFIKVLEGYLSGSKQKANIIQHIFIPLLRARNNQNILSYLAKVRNKNPEEGERDYIREFGRLFDSVKNPVLKSVGLSVYHQPKSFCSSDFTTRTFRVLKKVSGMTKGVLPALKKSKIRREIKISHYTRPAGQSQVAMAYDLLNKLETSKFNYEQNYEMLIEIVRTTAFQRQIYMNMREDTAKLYKQMSDILSNIIISIDNDIQKKHGNDSEIENLRNLKNMYLFLQNYTVEYLATLDCAANVAVFGGYIFHRSSFFERTKVMPLNRAVFGLSSGMKKAKSDLRKQIVTLYLSGNFLTDSLYSFPVMKNEVEEFIDDFDNPKQKTFVGMRKQWQNRESITKILSLVIASQAFLSAMTAYMFLGNTAIIPVIIALASGVGLSIFLHRIFKNIGFANLFYKKKKREIKKNLSDSLQMAKVLDLFSDGGKVFLNVKKITGKILKRKDIPEEVRTLAENTQKLASGYFTDYDFFRIKEIKINCLKICSGIKDDKIKKEINEIFAYFEQMRFSDPAKYDGLGNGFVTDDSLMHENTRQHLKNWLKIISKQELMKKDIEAVIFNAVQIIKLTSFSAEVTSEENKNRMVLDLQDFISFYETTLEKIKMMPQDKQKEAEHEILMIEKIGQYSVYYYDAMSNMFNIEILSGYRISKKNPFYFLEISGLMTLVRKVFGIDAGISLSKKRFQKSMAEVRTIGNSIIPGLYNGHFDSDITNFLQKKEKPRYFKLGINESWSVRKMLTRFFPLVFFANSVIQMVSASAFSPETLIVDFFKGVGLAIAFHWIPILFSFFKTNYKTGTLLKAIKKIANGNYKTEIEISRQDNLKKQITRLSEVPAGIMPDIVIVAGSSDVYDKENIMSPLKSILRQGNFKNLRIIPILSDHGGDGNCLIDVFEFIKSEDFKTAYPELASKSFGDLKITVINMGSANAESTAKNFDFQIIKGYPANAVELALLNGICMIQNNVAGGIVIVDPKYMYLGTFPEIKNMTLLSSKVSYEQVQKQNLPLLVTTPSDSYTEGEQLRKIYSKYNNDRIANIIVKNFLKKMYDLENKKINQIPTFSGIMAVSFDDGEKYLKIDKILSAVKEYEHSYEGRKFPVDMLSHLLIPLVMLANNEDIFVYLENLEYTSDMTPEERTDYDRFFYGLFIRIGESYGYMDKKDINIAPALNSLMSLNKPGERNFEDFMLILNLLSSWGKTSVSVQIEKETYHGFSKQVQSGGIKAVSITTDLNLTTRQYLSALNERGSNITITFAELLENPKSTGLFINVPSAGRYMGAEVVYDTFVDEYGREYFLVAFKYDRLINNLSDSAKKIILGRSALALIKELNNDKNNGVLEQNNLQFLKGYNPEFIFSFDNSGVFAKPELIDDDFFGDAALQKIKHVSVKTLYSDKTELSTDEAEDVNFSKIMKQYDLRRGISLSDISLLISDFGIDFDIDAFKNFPDTNLYYSGTVDSVFASAVQKKSGVSDVKIEEINIIPTIKLGKFSDISGYIGFFDDNIFKSVIVKDIFSDKDFFDFGLVSIFEEIKRLKEPNLQKLEVLLDEKKSSGKNGFFIKDNGTVFVLTRLLNFIKFNKEENTRFSDFVSSRSVEFNKTLSYYTAAAIADDGQIINDETVEKLMNQDEGKWNETYTLCLYMQYMAFIQYGDLCDYLASKKIYLSLTDDIIDNAGIKKIDIFSITPDQLKEELQNAKNVNVDITGIFEKISVLEVFKKITEIKHVILTGNRSYAAGVNSSEVFEDEIINDMSAGIIRRIEISDIDSMNGTVLFEYAHSLLTEAGFSNNGKYAYLFFYINKLKTQYKFADPELRESAIFVLKGFLYGIFEKQFAVNTVTGFGISGTINISAMLASA
ncbi:MAG: hypothetical protein PHR82_04040 [Endomicrobiaceae bacterium]|nr:hypothetical protein [Endomicrobiaceae bacterium]